MKVNVKEKYLKKTKEYRIKIRVNFNDTEVESVVNVDARYYLKQKDEVIKEVIKFVTALAEKDKHEK